MDVKKVLATFVRLAEEGGNLEALKVIARDVGHELPRERLDRLREFQAAGSLLLPSLKKEVEFFLAALLEVVGAYEHAIGEKDRTQEAVDLAQERGWGEVLRLLLQTPMRTSEVTTKVGERDTPESTMKKLTDMEGADFLSSSDSDDPLHHLTVLGEKVAKSL